MGVHVLIEKRAKSVSVSNNNTFIWKIGRHLGLNLPNAVFCQYGYMISLCIYDMRTDFVLSCVLRTVSQQRYTFWHLYLHKDNKSTTKRSFCCLSLKNRNVLIRV